MLKSSAAYRFPTELKEMKYEIQDHATAFGLDFFSVIFEVLDYQELNEVAAYGGYPYRYPHWRFGMEYDRLSKSHAYGLSKIYEMVINNDPCYAYLLKCNNLVDQKLVMAHVYGHCDFFKNNLYFRHTNRKMVDEMANHGTRIQRYVDRYGTDRVESFIDCCLSLENLIDPHWSFFRRREKEKPDRSWSANASQSSGSENGSCQCKSNEGESTACSNQGCGSAAAGCSGKKTEATDPSMDDDDEPISPRRLQSKAYMDPYINPPEFLRERTAEIKAKRREKLSLIHI